MAGKVGWLGPERVNSIGWLSPTGIEVQLSAVYETC